MFVRKKKISNQSCYKALAHYPHQQCLHRHISLRMVSYSTDINTT